MNKRGLLTGWDKKYVSEAKKLSAWEILTSQSVVINAEEASLGPCMTLM